MNYSQFPKIEPYPWYMRFLLLFKRPYYGYDFGAFDHSAIVTMKYLFGNVYVIDCKIVKRDE